MLIGEHHRYIAMIDSEVERYLLVEVSKLERFKDVPGFEGRYMVSSYGYIVAFTRRHHNKRLVSSLGPTGYLFVRLTREDGTKKNFILHTLIAKLFIDNPEKKPQVNHKDLNRLNNHVGNLEWATALENMRHAVVERRKRGIKRKNKSDVLYEDALEIRRLRQEKKLTYRELAEIFKLNINTIYKIVKGITHK